MAFPVDDILIGPDAFGRLHRLDGWIWHTGEEPGFTRPYAVATWRYQLTNPGSYNFRLYDRASDPRGVMLNVPYREASGGINPSSAAWAPGRFPFLREQLAKAGPCPVAGCPGPYLNPTMHHLQGSFVGTTAKLDAAAAPESFLADALALIEWSEGHPDRGPAPLVHSKHGHWQTNRSDCGDWMFTRLNGRKDEEMTWINQVRWYKTPVLVTFRPGTSYRLSPTLDDTGIYVSTIAEPRPVIGEVDGLDFGAGPLWLVIPGDGGVAKVAHSQDEMSRVPLGIVDPNAVTNAVKAATDPLLERLRIVRKDAEHIVQVAS